MRSTPSSTSNRISQKNTKTACIMKQLPGILTLLALLAAPVPFSSCGMQQLLQQDEEDRMLLDTLAEGKAELKAAKEAAYTCASMEWHATVTSYPRLHKGENNEWIAGEPLVETFTIPVSEEDARTIRGLILHKMEAVPVMIPPPAPLPPGAVGSAEELRFLDATGKVIHSFNPRAVSRVSSRPETSTSGKIQYYNTRFTLPAPDYETWGKLIPAVISTTFEKRDREWEKRMGLE